MVDNRYVLMTNKVNYPYVICNIHDMTYESLNYELIDNFVGELITTMNDLVLDGII